MAVTSASVLQIIHNTVADITACSMQLMTALHSEKPWKLTVFETWDVYV